MPAHQAHTISEMSQKPDFTASCLLKNVKCDSDRYTHYFTIAPLVHTFSCCIWYFIFMFESIMIITSYKLTRRW